MNLKTLTDQELLGQTKILVQKEREYLTQILHHLREVERRKLFSDLKYTSLFEYAVKELRYSEGQAGRRIQAMRLIKELPEVENKISDGSLNLSNLCQAQSYFREARVSQPQKMEILKSLENKSAREGQKVLLGLQPQASLPKERERMISEMHTEVRIVMDEELREALEELRSLLGAEGAQMKLADLIKHMAKVNIQVAKAKKFGKKRANANLATTPASESRGDKNPRYLSRSVRHRIWLRDQGKCVNCGGRKNLQYDHIKAVAKGGSSESENLRLLCFHCNQRRAMIEFGAQHIERRWKP